MAFTQWASNAGFLVGAILAGAVIVPTFGLEAVFRYTGIAVALGAVAFALMMRRAQPELDRIRAEYGERECSRVNVPSRPLRSWGRWSEQRRPLTGLRCGQPGCRTHCISESQVASMRGAPTANRSTSIPRS